MTDAERPATRSITATVGRAEQAASPYLMLPFDVPVAATRIDLRLSYPKAADCIIDLGLGDDRLDPFPSEAGLVGWSGGARSEIFVATDAASPGYVPGIRPGQWQVILGLHRMPEEPVEVVVEIGIGTAPRPAVSQALPSPVLRDEPGWYRGDLQCHTYHSDAKGSPETLHATARREGLDFLAVTDHNTTTAHAAYFDAVSGPDLLFVPAYEFTTGRGHGNVFGAREVVDFRVRTDADVVEMIARIRERGHLMSINHDKPDIPWDYPVPEVDCMEVWQAPWLAGNHISLARYQARLAEGRRLAAIGGSDFHQPVEEAAGNLATLARPCTYLYCQALSVDGVLDAIRAGRSYVTEAPDGPRLILAAGGVGHGGTVTAGGPMSVTYEAVGAPGDVLELWDATGCIASVGLEGPTARGDVDLRPKGFVRGQIVARASRDSIVAAACAHVAAGRGGRMDWDGSWDHPVIRALTSPIYVI